MADENQKFKCPDCGRDFDTKDSMLQHRRDAHESAAAQSSEKKPFKLGKLVLPIVVIVILLGVGGLVYWILGYSSSNTGGIASFNYSFVPYEGNSSAKINVIEFGDYQCPICAEWFVQSQTQLLNDYVNTGKARFYFMDFSFLGPDSYTLAQGAWCANDQGLYYPYHDFIYSNQGTESTGWASPAKLKAIVADLPGLNTQQFNACLDSLKYDSQDKLLTRVGQDSGVTGTPTFFIGNANIGYLSVVGNQPYSVFKQSVETQLAKVS